MGTIRDHAHMTAFFQVDKQLLQGKKSPPVARPPDSIKIEAVGQPGNVFPVFAGADQHRRPVLPEVIKHVHQRVMPEYCHYTVAFNDLLPVLKTVFFYPAGREPEPQQH